MVGVLGWVGDVAERKGGARRPPPALVLRSYRRPPVRVFLLVVKGSIACGTGTRSGVPPTSRLMAAVFWHGQWVQPESGPAPKSPCGVPAYQITTRASGAMYIGSPGWIRNAE